MVPAVEEILDVETAVPAQTVAAVEHSVHVAQQTAATAQIPDFSDSNERFYSPLVKNIAREEGISASELEYHYSGNRKRRPGYKNMISCLI